MLVEKRERVILLTMDRPPLNVLDITLLRELDEILTTCAQALAMGLVNRLLPKDQLETGLESLLEELLGKSGAVLRITLKGLRELSLKNFPDALKRSEELYCHELLRTEDVEEGVQAFLAKRKPRWVHR